MKHYVLGFIFSQDRKKVLLVKKEHPEWQAGRWNGIGGKIKEDDRSPLQAMQRECFEETNTGYNWEHCITFVCSGGTVFVYKAISDYSSLEHPEGEIAFKQMEDELLAVWRVDGLAVSQHKIDGDLNWLITVCLSTIKFPICVHQNILGE